MDVHAAAERLSRIIQCQTVPRGDANGADWCAVMSLADVLRESYPRLHETLRVETITDCGLLYHWGHMDAGSDAGEGAGDGFGDVVDSEIGDGVGNETGDDAGAIVLLAHVDVAPVDDPESWTHPPFSGAIADGCVWGRGALDTKGQLIALFEAIESLIAAGFAPKRDVYIALGVDKHFTLRMGTNGLTSMLRERGVRIDMVLAASANCFFPAALLGASGTMACVYVGETGNGTLSIECDDARGYANVPDGTNHRKRLAAAAARIARKPMPARLARPITDMIDALLPHMPPRTRFLYRHRRLFGRLLLRQLSQHPQTNAWTRSAVMPSMPEDAAVGVNAPSFIRFKLRCAPWDSLRRLVYHIRFRVRDPNVRIRVDALPATSISLADGPAYAALTAAVRDCFPDVIPVPSLMLDSSDAAYCCNDCDNVYRFSPFRCYAHLEHTVHTLDERIECDSLAEGIAFYVALLKRANAARIG